MTEPDVALTDYGLSVECAVFAWLIFRQTARSTALRAWVVLFFGATALAALCGGTVHGFFTVETAGVGPALWKVSMLSIGGAALAGWAIGGRLLFPRRGADRVLVFATGLIVAYAATIVFLNDAFVVAVAGYVPAAAALLAGFIRAAVRRQGGWATLGVWAMALSFAAAAIQQLRVALHPVYFNHNALYHVVQAAALALLFAACRGLLHNMGDLHADTA